jgi:hypothetical protein
MPGSAMTFRICVCIYIYIHTHTHTQRVANLENRHVRSFTTEMHRKAMTSMTDVCTQCRPVSAPTKSRKTRAAAVGTCKASGPYCEDCDRLVVCANMGENVLASIVNISCSEIDTDMTCNQAVCTTQAPGTQACEGSDKAGTFRCLQPGFFPDPADCKTFHVCGSDLSHFSGKQSLCSDVMRLYCF